MPRRPTRAALEKAHAAFARDILNRRGEDDVRAQIKEWLAAVTGGIDHVELEKSVTGGSIDILVESHKIVIETKTRGKAGPGNPGSKQGETQLGQLSRYLDYMKNNEGLFANDTPWLGAITDGMKWFFYQWNAEQRRAEPLGDPVEFNPGLKTREIQAAEIYQRHFSSIKRKAGKPPPPEDLTGAISEPFMRDLWELYEDEEGQRHLPTKFELWKDILKGSGILPLQEKQAKTSRLFVRHCVLVSITRAIVAEITQAKPDPKRALSGGFTAWITDTEQGHGWAKDLFRRIQTYNWRASHGGTLKQAYEGLIPQKDRHGFGEYYTPGWLAEFLCGQILDEDWLSAAVQSAMLTLDDPKALRPVGHGVLDPACGSGVFLFHAARRIVAHAAKEENLGEVECATIAARLVHGIDIHPVAVEMAKATLLSALPAVPAGGLSVHQGDSMLLKYKKDELRGLGGGGLDVSSPKGSRFRIPQAVLESENFRTIIKDVVDFAAPPPPQGDTNSAEAKPAFSQRHWARPIAPESLGEIEALAAQLRKIYEAEGNSIWEWYIHNLAQPLRLHREKMDRLIGNPPWVSTAAGRRDDEHQKAVEQIARDYGLRSGGLGGSASESNFAAPFLLRCRELYLAEKNAKCAFVLPYSALRSSGWKSFADPVKFASWTETHDLSKMQDGPFKGSSDASLWIDQGESRRRRTARIWKNRSAEKVTPLDSWNDVNQKIEIRTPTRRPKPAPSFYEDSFRKRANLNPTRFVVVEIVKEYPDGSVQVRGRTGSRDKKPWDSYKPTDARVERAALLPAIIPDNLQSFRVAPPAYYVMGPFHRSDAPVLYEISEVDSLTSDWGEIGPRFKKVWKVRDEQYREHRPRSLAELLDYSGNLTIQLPLNEARSGKRLLYNKSGQHLIATRLNSPHQRDFIANDMTYYWTASSEQEALFLVGIMNAETLQQAYRETQQSGWDFHKHIWRKIPIPKFDKNNPLHAEVVKASRACEKLARNLPTEMTRKNLRTTLTAAPEMRALNQAVKNIPELRPYCGWRSG